MTLLPTDADALRLARRDGPVSARPTVDEAREARKVWNPTTLVGECMLRAAELPSTDGASAHPDFWFYIHLAAALSEAYGVDVAGARATIEAATAPPPKSAVSVSGRGTGGSEG